MVIGVLQAVLNNGTEIVEIVLFWGISIIIFMMIILGRAEKVIKINGVWLIGR
jgi:hypothetical protein